MITINDNKDVPTKTVPKTLNEVKEGTTFYASKLNTDGTWSTRRLWLKAQNSMTFPYGRSGYWDVIVVCLTPGNCTTPEKHSVVTKCTQIKDYEEVNISLNVERI